MFLMLDSAIMHTGESNSVSIPWTVERSVNEMDVYEWIGELAEMGVEGIDNNRDLSQIRSSVWSHIHDKSAVRDTLQTWNQRAGGTS
jgi:hypothetical protein